MEVTVQSVKCFQKLNIFEEMCLNFLKLYRNKTFHIRELLTKNYIYFDTNKYLLRSLKAWKETLPLNYSDPWKSCWNKCLIWSFLIPQLEPCVVKNYFNPFETKIFLVMDILIIYFCVIVLLAQIVLGSILQGKGKQLLRYYAVLQMDCFPVSLWIMVQSLRITIA